MNLFPNSSKPSQIPFKLQTQRAYAEQKVSRRPLH